MAAPKHCVIFAAMPVSAGMQPYWQDADCILAADAGYRTAQALGLCPHYLMGDYDGSPAPVGAERLPCEKDDTDTHYAAKRAFALGAKKVTILGGLGGRLDHTLANLATLLFLARGGAEAVLADEENEVRVLVPGEHSFQRRPGCFVSLFPADGPAEGVSLSGLKYPLHEATLTSAFPIGVSNEFAAPCAHISLKKGALYLVFSARHPQNTSCLPQA